MSVTTISEHKPHVVVVGAGIAGLAAARTLIDSGLAVTIVEGRERIGGRIWTDRSWHDLPIDLGASWIHGIEGNAIATLASQFQIDVRPTSYESAPLTYEADGKLLSRQRAAVRTCFDRIVNKLRGMKGALPKDLPLGVALERIIADAHLSPQLERRVRHLIHIEIEQEYATETFCLSLHHWEQVGGYNGAHAIFPGGYDQIIKRLAEGLIIRLGHVVTQIDYTQNEIIVFTTGGEIKCDSAIITLPLGVLRCGEIRFEPRLPNWKIIAIRNLRMGTLNKIFLRFPRPFWPERNEWFECISEQRPRWPIFFNLLKYSGKPVLVGFSAGNDSREQEYLPDAAVVSQATTALRNVFKAAFVDPCAMRVTRWASDPFARGAYCHIPPCASGADCDALARPIESRVFFAGEATSRTRYGTVHGAYLSGTRAARQLARAYGRGR
jgi:monoamine oxidase